MRTIIEMIAIAWTIGAALDVVQFAGSFAEAFCRGLCSSMRRPA